MIFRVIFVSNIIRTTIAKCAGAGGTRVGRCQLKGNFVELSHIVTQS